MKDEIKWPQLNIQHRRKLRILPSSKMYTNHTLVSSSTSLCHMAKPWQTFFPLDSSSRIEGKINSLELFF